MFDNEGMGGLEINDDSLTHNPVSTLELGSFFKSELTEIFTLTLTLILTLTLTLTLTLSLTLTLTLTLTRMR